MHASVALNDVYAADETVVERLNNPNRFNYLVEDCFFATVG